LFEIKFVEHQDAFYQLRKLYVYKLQVELFQYSSEVIDTGVTDIDVFQSLKTTDTTLNPDIDRVSSFGDNNAFRLEAESIVFNPANPFGEVQMFDFTADSAALYADSTNIKSDKV
jgi:hypothetical protein